MSAFEKIDDERFRYYVLRENGDIYHALKHFFKKEEAPAFDGASKLRV